MTKYTPNSNNINEENDTQSIATVTDNDSISFANDISEIEDFTEILGTDGYDSLWGADSQIVYGLAGDDSLNSILSLSGGSLPDGEETTILVGGSGDNSYQARKNSTAIVIENSNSDDNLLYTTIGNDSSVGIGLEKSSSFFAEIDNRHLYLGDTVSNQYAVLIDWQEPKNQIETFDLAEGRVSYSNFAESFRDAEGYRGNLTWLEVAEERNLERLGLSTDSFDDELELINAKAAELEPPGSSEPEPSPEPEPEPVPSNVGNFTEVVGTDANDSLTGSDLEIIYGIGDGDSLVAGADSTNILVGGTGRNLYSIRENAIAAIFENSGSDDNTLFTNVLAPGIDRNSDNFIIADVENRHLFFGDTDTNQYAFLVDWQQPENQIETFYFLDEIIDYDTLANSYRDSSGYLGDLSWSELAERETIDTERLGLDIDSFNDEIESINARATELENLEEPELEPTPESEPDEDLLDTDIIRFQNNDVPGTYLYVAQSEAQNIRDNFDNFTEEGKAFQVAVETGDDLMPMYRFQSEDNPGTYLFVGESERENIKENFSDSFTEEGLAFYTYDADSELGTDFYRFQNTVQPGTYLFATGEERENINQNFPDLVEEGIAFSVDV